MGTITTLYDVTISYFSHRVLEVFAHTFIIYTFRFSHRFFRRLYSLYEKFNRSRRSVTVQKYMFT
jgi:hypothetical protein